jgi:ferritin-like metal-binding protein YciE
VSGQRLGRPRVCCRRPEFLKRWSQVMRTRACSWWKATIPRVSPRSSRPSPSIGTLNAKRIRRAYSVGPTISTTQGETTWRKQARSTTHSLTNCRTYDAEKKLTKALPKLAKASSNPKLRQAFESHLEETQGQIARLEKVFASLDEKVRGKHCDGIAGVIEEGKSIMEEDFDDTTMDACLIAAGQRAEHYEMAAYGTLVAWAQAMGHTKRPRSCNRRLTKRRLPTRSCRNWPKAASIRARRTPPSRTMRIRSRQLSAPPRTRDQHPTGHRTIVADPMP